MPDRFNGKELLPVFYQFEAHFMSGSGTQGGERKPTIVPPEPTAGPVYPMAAAIGSAIRRRLWRL